MKRFKKKEKMSFNEFVGIYRSLFDAKEFDLLKEHIDKNFKKKWLDKIPMEVYNIIRDYLS